MKRYLKSPRCYVYASVHMHQDIVKRFKLLNHTGNVTVAYAQCDHHSLCDYKIFETSKNL